MAFWNIEREFICSVVKVFIKVPWGTTWSHLWVLQLFLCQGGGRVQQIRYLWRPTSTHLRIVNTYETVYVLCVGYHGRILHGPAGTRILSSSTSAACISHEWAKRTSERYFLHQCPHMWKIKILSSLRSMTIWSCSKRKNPGIITSASMS